MRNNLMWLMGLVWLLAGCSISNPFAKPVVNIYYIKDANSTPPTIKIGDDRVRMYFVYKNGCYGCDSMKKKMREPLIATLLKDEFIIKMVNIRDKESLPHAWMRPFAAPTIYFLDRNRKELVPSIHSTSSSKFLSTLKEAISARDIE